MKLIKLAFKIALAILAIKWVWKDVQENNYDKEFAKLLKKNDV